jgi:hypothetical protein
MAIDPQEFNWRLDAIVETFEAAKTTTLAAQLPATVSVWKGPPREEAASGKFAVFICRRGTPSVVYDMGTHTATVTMTVDVSAMSYSVADSDLFEGYIAIFSANIVSLLFSLLKRSGTDGWYKGIWRGSAAVNERKDEEQQTTELELHVFDVTFEVTY